MTEQAEATRITRRSNLIENPCTIWIIREGKSEVLTPAQERYIQARKKLLGPEAWGPVTKENLTEFISSGIRELDEAISKGGVAGEYASRGDRHLGGLKSTFQNALEVLEGRRKSPFALLAAVQHATIEEREQAEIKSKEEVRAIKTGIKLSPDGFIGIQRYPSSSLGRHTRELDLQRAEQLPTKVISRGTEVADFIKEQFGQK